MDQFHLLTIIAEESLTTHIQQEVEQLGAKGYTLSVVSGKHMSNLRDSPWTGGNVKIETVVTEATCRRILQHFQHKYFDRYAMIAFHHPVSVLRTEHFS